MTLEDHKQETEKKEKEKLTRLDWDVNPGYRSTKSSGRLDWGINTAEKTLHTHDNGRDQAKPLLHPPDRISASIEPPKEKNHHRWRSRGGGGGRQATPHRKGRRRVGPNTAVLLHPNRPPEGTKTTEFEASHSRVRGDTNPPLSMPLSLSCAGTSNPPHGSRSGLVLRIAVESSKKRCTAPDSLIKP
jgi:hypothetical protein